MESAILSDEQILGNSLGHQVGDTYAIHGETSKVLDDINRRLTEEDKNLRTYRRALAFSQMIQKDLVPILVNSMHNLEVFDAVIRLMVNLTVPVECLCPLEILTKSEDGRQTIYELSNSLLKTKEVFRDPRTTRVIMERLSRYATNDKISSMEVTLVNNCLLLIRNILHIPDSQSSKNVKQKCSNQNQIMWNLFAQNIDKILLDLIKNNMRSIWCTSVVQLIALVYKDQHVITLQKLLQNFLESSLSESSEDNESNTSPQYQNGSCSPTTDDSSDQASRETSTPELKVVTVRQRRDSCGSLEVLPNNSPAPSEGPLSPGSPMSPSSNKQTSPSGPLSPTSQKPMSPGLPLSPSSHKPSTASQPMSPASHKPMSEETPPSPASHKDLSEEQPLSPSSQKLMSEDPHSSPSSQKPLVGDPTMSEEAPVSPSSRKRSFPGQPVSPSSQIQYLLEEKRFH